MDEVKAKINNVDAMIINVHAKLNNVDAALAGRSNDAGDYAAYARLSFQDREEKLRSLRTELSTQMTQLYHEKMALLKVENPKPKPKAEEELSEQQPFKCVGKFVDIAQKKIAGLHVDTTPFYLRSESVELWNKIESVTDQGNNVRVSGPPAGTGKSIGVWAWALWKAKTTGKKVIWFGIAKGSYGRKIVIDGETKNVLQYEVEINDIRDFQCDFIVVDGVTKELDAPTIKNCKFWRQRRQSKKELMCSFITVSSVRVILPGEFFIIFDLTAHQVPSWSLDQK